MEPEQESKPDAEALGVGMMSNATDDAVASSSHAEVVKPWQRKIAASPKRGRSSSKEASDGDEYRGDGDDKPWRKKKGSPKRDDSDKPWKVRPPSLGGTIKTTGAPSPPISPSSAAAPSPTRTAVLAGHIVHAVAESLAGDSPDATGDAMATDAVSTVDDSSFPAAVSSALWKVRVEAYTSVVQRLSDMQTGRDASDPLSAEGLDLFTQVLGVRLFVHLIIKLFKTTTGHCMYSFLTLFRRINLPPPLGRLPAAKDAARFEHGCPWRCGARA